METFGPCRHARLEDAQACPVCLNSDLKNEQPSKEITKPKPAKPALWTFGLATLLLIVTEAPPPSLKLICPEGWRDLSPGTSSAEIGNFPSQLVALRDDPETVALFIDKSASRSGLYPNINARRARSMGEVTESLLRAELDRPASKDSNGIEYTFLGAKTLTIGGVTCGRVERAGFAGGIRFRTLVYVIPDGEWQVLVTYASPDDEYAKLVNTFDKLAQSSTGVRFSPPHSQRAARSGLRGALWAWLVLGLLATFLNGLAEAQKRTSTQSGPPNGSA